MCLAMHRDSWHDAEPIHGANIGSSLCTLNSDQRNEMSRFEGAGIQPESPESRSSDTVDTRSLDEAVRHINKVLAETVYRGAVEVGEYVFERFFGGDAELVRSKNPRKPASFRLLAARCGTPELPISSTWLYNAVGIAMTRRPPPS